MAHFVIVVVCVSQFAIVGSCSGCSCCCHNVPVALGGKDKLAMLLIEDVLTLLMMPKDCCWSRSAIAVLLSVCHDFHCQCHCRIAFRLLLLCSDCSQSPVVDNDRCPVQHGGGQKFIVILLMAHLSIVITGPCSAAVLLSE